MKDQTPADCLNCGQSVAGLFCSHCGQQAAAGRLRLRELLAEAVSHFSSLDSKVPRTVVHLTRAPGRVALDYVRGRRVPYVQPLRYCLTILAAVIFLNLVTGFDPSRVTLGSAPLSENQREVQRLVGDFALRHLDVSVLLVLPVFILVVKLLFRRSGFNYPEVGAFVLYTVGHVLLLGLILSPLRWVAPAPALALRLIFHVAFFSWAATTFFDVSPVVGTVKGIFATVTYVMLVALTVVLLTLPKILAVVRPS